MRGCEADALLRGRRVARLQGELHLAATQRSAGNHRRFTFLLGELWPNVVFAAAASVFVITKHGANIGRLLRHEELRLDFSRPTT
jgi:glycerol-3-phosphate acyltransferase PlsY